MVVECCYNKFSMIFFPWEENMKTREDKRMAKLEVYLFIYLYVF